MNRVVLAAIVRERGNRGEVIALSLTDIPGRLEQLKSAFVRLADGSDLPVTLEEAWQHKEGWVLRFAGVIGISEAERFRNAELWVPREERAQLADGEWFRSDLLGCRLVDDADGASVGTIAGWQDFGGPPLMEVAREGREVLVPFVPALCRKVDLEAKEVRVAYPDGMLADLLAL